MPCLWPCASPTGTVSGLSEPRPNGPEDDEVTGRRKVSPAHCGGPVDNRLCVERGGEDPALAGLTSADGEASARGGACPAVDRSLPGLNSPSPSVSSWSTAQTVRLPDQFPQVAGSPAVVGPENEETGGQRRLRGPRPDATGISRARTGGVARRPPHRLVLVGAGQGGANGPLIALLGHLTPDERTSRAMATNNVLGDLGGGVGPMVSLPVVESVGFTPVYVACAVIPLLAGVSLFVGIYTRTGNLNPRTARVSDE